MTKILIVLGIVLVIAGGSLTALSDDGASGKSGEGSDISRQLRDAPAIVETQPTPVPTEASVSNRQDCNAIRGQQYLSEEERNWFLNNCVAR